LQNRRYYYLQLIIKACWGSQSEADVWKVTQWNFTALCAFAYKLCYVLLSSGGRWQVEALAASQKVAGSIPHEVAVFFS
jgi:hypothetical protein